MWLCLSVGGDKVMAQLLTTNVLCTKDCFEDDSDTLIYNAGEIYQTTDRRFIMDNEYCNRQWVVDLKIMPDFWIYFKLIEDEN